MHEDYKKKLLNDLLENKYYDFKIELKDSFILDLKELEENSHITREDFKTEFSKLLHEVNISLMDNENQKKKNKIIYSDKVVKIKELVIWFFELFCISINNLIKIIKI